MDALDERCARSLCPRHPCFWRAFSSSSGAVRRERHEMDEGQRNTMWPEQMEVSRKSGCGRWDVFSFSLSSAVLCLSRAPFIHQDWGEKWMQSLSYSISQHFSPSPSQIWQNAHLTSTEPGENETNCDPPSSSGTELSGPVTHLTFVALNTLLNTYSVTFMKDKTYYIIYLIIIYIYNLYII